MRTSSIKRIRNNINLKIDIDGSGDYECASDHVRSSVVALSKHSLIDITLSATGDDIHRMVEDVAICLGRPFARRWEKARYYRMADTSVPMDNRWLLWPLTSAAGDTGT